MDSEFLNEEDDFSKIVKVNNLSKRKGKYIIIGVLSLMMIIILLVFLFILLRNKTPKKIIPKKIIPKKNEKFISMANFISEEIKRGNNYELPDLLSKYINNQEVINFEANNQIGGTCYANAIAASFYLAESRIIGRKRHQFKDILDYLVDKNGVNGGKTFKIAKEESGKYKLGVTLLEELSWWEKLLNVVGKVFGREESLSLAKKVKESVKNERQVLVSYELTGKQWCNFDEFFSEKNKKGILDSYTLNKDDCTYAKYEDGRHAVLLVNATDNYLEFLNSWGKDFGDNGRFKLSSFETIKIMDYMEVYNSKDLLSDTENNMWSWYIDYFRNLFKKVYDKKVEDELDEIICPICQKNFSSYEYKGDFSYGECPICHQTFYPSGDNAVKLYIKYITEFTHKHTTSGIMSLFSIFTKKRKRYIITDN